jgi:MoaA/NifB/PqqE/SkfB family radical SAM enzyme
MNKSFLDKIKIFNKKEMKKYCSVINGGLIFTEDAKVSLCKKGKEEFVIISDFNGLWVDTAKIKEDIKYNKTLPLSEACSTCCYLSDDLKRDNFALDFVVFAHWKSCFLHCVYCREEKTDDLLTVKHSDITPVIEQLIDDGLISRDTVIIFDCGDAILHPEFEKLLYFLMNFGIKNVEIHTSALRYCQAVSDAIAKDIAKVIISIDSGCPYIYEQIKGVNKFDLMIDTVKRYVSVESKSSKNVILNYTLVQGVNDNKKEIIDWFMLSRNLGVKKLSVDITDKWYDSIEVVPTHLREIISFVRELSELNRFEIELSEKIKDLSIR